MSSAPHLSPATPVVRYGYVILMLTTGPSGCRPSGREATAKYVVPPSASLVKAEEFDLHEVRLLDGPFKRAMERNAALHDGRDR